MQLSGSNFRLYNKRLSHPLLAILLLLTVLLVACQGETGEEPGPAEETPAEIEEVPVPTPEPAQEEPSSEEPAEEPAGEAIFRVAMQPIVQTDPSLISSDSEVLVANHVYDYLVDIDPESNPQPRLATEWEISDDGLTYVFTLAEGVTWHDGDPFTAEDVVWTFNRLKGEGLPTADLYANVTGIEASGEGEVTFTLAEPNPFFLYDLSDNHALIVKNGTEDATEFNGTGPFIVTNYSPEDRIEMEANPNYWVEGQPQLAGLHIIFFNDETAAADALRGGQVDLTMRMSTAIFESLQEEPGIETIAIPTNGYDTIRLRTDRPPGDDPRVVQALKLATDRQAIFELIQQGYGTIGNDSPIGPLPARYHAADVAPPARDVEEARRLLEEAGYGDGLELVLHTPDTGGRPDLAALLQSQWAEAGINLELSVEPESVYYGENGWLEVDLGITGWGSRPYSQFYLDVMVACDAIWNEAHYCDEEVDRLIELAGTTQDDEERVEAYHELQRILAARGPYIIPYYFAQFAAVNDQFENFKLKAFAGRTDLREVSAAE